MPTRLRPWGVWRWGRCRGWFFCLLAGVCFFFWCFWALALICKALVAIVFVVDGVLFLRPEAGSRPGGRGTCSLLRQRKVPKRKATHSLRPLRVATGQTCVGAVAGCAVELATRWRAALGQPRRVSSRGMRAPTRMLTPQPPRRRRSQMGVGKEHPNIHTGHCCARPSLRSARRLRPSGLGRAQQWPVWMSGFGFPSGCAEERRFWRIRARVCLSDAKRREFSETPAKQSTAGCPQRSEGTQPVGSLFLGLLSFGEAKESESAAGAKSRPPPRTQACTQA